MKKLFMGAIIIALALFVASCASKPSMIGKWEIQGKQKGQNAQMEIKTDGTIVALEKDAKAEKMNYKLDDSKDPMILTITQKQKGMEMSVKFDAKFKDPNTMEWTIKELKTPMGTIKPPKPEVMTLKRI